MIGIICTMLNGFGAKGLYNSQEIGLAKAVADLTKQKVVVYKAVTKSEDQSTISDDVTVKYIRCKKVGNAHGYMDTRWLDTTWHGEKMNALICFCDQQIFIPHIYRFCKKNGVQMLLYTGIIRSNRGGVNASISQILFHFGTKQLYKKVPVVAKTKGVKKELGKIGARDVVVAPVGMDPKALNADWRYADRTELRREFHYTPEDTVVLCISRMEKEKNIMDLIDLAKKCRVGKKNVKFLVIGTGRQEAEFKDAVRAEHLDNIVQIIDKIPHSEIWKAYVAADYYANLCRDEIFGMSIMEAVYYETPAAAIHAYGPDTILDGVKASVEIDDVSEMADWICSTYPSKDDLAYDADLIARKFTWYRTAEIMLDRLGIVYADPGTKSKTIPATKRRKE